MHLAKYVIRLNKIKTAPVLPAQGRQVTIRRQIPQFKYIVSSSGSQCNQNSCSLMAVIFILKIQKEMIFYGISKRQKPQ